MIAASCVMLDELISAGRTLSDPALSGRITGFRISEAQLSKHMANRLGSCQLGLEEGTVGATTVRLLWGL